MSCCCAMSLNLSRLTLLQHVFLSWRQVAVTFKGLAVECVATGHSS